jgi:hypothetical protein
MTLDEQNEIVDQIALPYWRAKFGELLGIGLAITISISLALHGLVHVIGWVISGFAASPLHNPSLNLTPWPLAVGELDLDAALLFRLVSSRKIEVLHAVRPAFTKSILTIVR